MAHSSAKQFDYACAQERAGKQDLPCCLCGRVTAAAAAAAAAAMLSPCSCDTNAVKVSRRYVMHAWHVVCMHACDAVQCKQHMLHHIQHSSLHTSSSVQATRLPRLIARQKESGTAVCPSSTSAAVSASAPVSLRLRHLQQWYMMVKGQSFVQLVSAASCCCCRPCLLLAAVCR
jgi:hypothetical protein